MYSVNKKKSMEISVVWCSEPSEWFNKISCLYYYVDCKSCRADSVQICSKLVFNIDAGGLEDIWAGCLVTSHPDIDELPFSLPCVCLVLKFNYHRINLLTPKH